MFAAFHLFALFMISSCRGVAVERQNGVPPGGFKCQPGFELTSYTTAGVATCTKIAGSSITPGYAGQTVVFVGLASGLTTMLFTYLPRAVSVYRAGRGYFARPGSGWENAFPRAIGSDSAVYSDLKEHIHGSWDEAHRMLQEQSFDPNSTIVFTTSENSTSATFNHGDFVHKHIFHFIPHNETHDTWQAHFEMTSTKDDVPGGLDKRENSFTGARITFNNVPISGVYTSVPISRSDAAKFGDDLVDIYLNSVLGGQKDQLCSYMGSVHPYNKPYTEYEAEITIVSQVGGVGGMYPATVCSSSIDAGLAPNDEL